MYFDMIGVLLKSRKTHCSKSRQRMNGFIVLKIKRDKSELEKGGASSWKYSKQTCNSLWKVY